MAKKSSKKKKNKDDRHERGPLEALGHKLDERPEVQRAEAALSAAREQLESAHARYQEVRDQARERIETLGEQKPGELIDEVLTQVRKRPVASAAISFVAGVFLGRLLRR